MHSGTGRRKSRRILGCTRLKIKKGVVVKTIEVLSKFCQFPPNLAVNLAPIQLRVGLSLDHSQGKLHSAGGR